MKKLSLLFLLTVTALCLAMVTTADVTTAASVDGVSIDADQLDVLSLMGLETPDWLSSQPTTASHFSCGSSTVCNYRLVGCCCIPQNRACSTKCF